MRSFLCWCLILFCHSDCDGILARKSRNGVRSSYPNGREGGNLEDTARSLSRLSEFNEKCRTSSDCRNFGYVCRENRTCQCDFMYVPDAEKKSCVGGIDQKCIYDEHCIKGAFCMNQEICKCKDTSPIVLEEGLLCSGQQRTIHPHFLQSLLIIIAAFRLIL